MSLRPATYQIALERKQAQDARKRSPPRSQIKRNRMKPGKKVATWNSQRAWLKVEFQKRGIVTCELRLSRCWHDNALSFAHSRKRTDPEYDPYQVVLACTPCHDQVEVMGHEPMYNRVMGIINIRGGVIRP